MKSINRLFLAGIALTSFGIVSIFSSTYQMIEATRKPVIVPPTPTVQEAVIYPSPRFSEEEERALAKVVWGEARGCSKTEQAAVVWCVLNRVDSELFPDSVLDVLEQPHQFDGYKPSHPVDVDILEVVQDVLDRYDTVGEEGRVIPYDYLFFEGDGKSNHFRKEWRSGEEWDWSLPSPYID